METRVVCIAGKNRTQRKRVCEKCKKTEWVYLGNCAKNCNECFLKTRQSISIGSYADALPQDEEKNRALIDAWLKKNKPTVIEPSL